MTWGILLLTMTCVATQAQSVGSTAGAARRQLIGCMTKQMSASKTISYNDAAKVCKDLTKTVGETASSADGHPGNNR